MIFVDLEKTETHTQIKTLCQGQSGVYLITNLKNNNRYIGSAVTKKPSSNRLYIRFRNHFFNTHKTFPIKQAIKKYGVHNFSWKILEFTERDSTRSRETHWIQTLKPEYNILQFGSSSLGFQHTQETRDKMKQGFSEERRIAIQKLNLGFCKNQEIRAKLSETVKMRTPEQKRKHQQACDVFNKRMFSKPTQVLDSETGVILGRYSSLSEACRAWNGDLRTFKRCVKSGKKVTKFNILVKYIL